MSWLDCTTRPPGYYGGGDGPGGGGDGDGGCIGNGCDDDGACNEQEYFKCDKTIPECQSVGFKSPEQVGVTDGTCQFPDVFNTGSEIWYKDNCPEPCDPVECSFFICNGDGDPGTPDPCEEALGLWSNSPDMIACGGQNGDYTVCPPGPTCNINTPGGAKTGYKGPEGKDICEQLEDDCQGSTECDGLCWECPSTGNEGDCCTLTCHEVLVNNECVCPTNCWEDDAAGNGQAFCNNFGGADGGLCNPYICWECDTSDFDCDEVKNDCATDCNPDNGQYKNLIDCEEECTDEVCDECIRYSCIEGCDPLEFDDPKSFSDCVLEETVWSQESDCLNTPKDPACSNTGYTTNNGFYATTQEALANCISCKDAYECDTESEFEGGTCVDTCEVSVDSGTDGMVRCTVPSECYPGDEECYTSECKCRWQVVCQQCVVEKDGGDGSSCTDCSVVKGERDEFGLCKYLSQSGEEGFQCDGKTYNFDEIINDPKYADCVTACDGANIGSCTPARLACISYCKTSNYCWECADDSEECCTQTCYSVNGPDDCPTDCWVSDSLCKPNCTQTCWECVTGGVEDFDAIGPGDVDGDGSIVIGSVCKEIEIPCDIPCESANYYPSKTACEEVCNTESNFFNDNDKAIDLVYKYNYVDSVYERNLSNQKYPQLNTPFTPVNKGSLPDGVFRRNVHASIYATNAMNNASGMLFSDFPYSDITNAHLEQSLDLELVSLLNEVKLATGEPIKRRILGMIRNLIISNRLHTLDVGELKGMLRRVKEQQGKYSETRGAYSLPGTHASEAQALKLAGEKAWDVNPDSYRGSTIEKMRLWKTIATDLDKSIPVRLSDGSLKNLYYSVSDTIPLETSGTMTLSPGDVQQVGSSYIAVSGDYERGRILQLEDLQKVCSLLGEEYSFTMNVKTDETIRLDERYGVSSTRQDFYMLTLEPSSIDDLDRDNPFVAKTKAKYTYQTNGPIRNDWVKYRPWPYMVFYVDADDPIFNYITNDGEVNITSTDFVTDLFEDDPNMMRFIRRLPWTVVLIPSDKSNNVPSHVISTQKAYGERELKFLVNPDPKRSDTWYGPHLREHHSYPGPGVNPSKPDINALYYSVYTDQINAVEKYTNGAPTLPRPTFGMRDVLSTLKDLKDNYILNGRGVNWPQIYESVPRSKMKNLFQEVPDWESFKTKAAFGKISTVDSVNENYPKVRDVRSNNRGIRDTNLNTYYKAGKLPDSEVTPPPGPLE